MFMYYIMHLYLFKSFSFPISHLIYAMAKKQNKTKKYISSQSKGQNLCHIYCMYNITTVYITLTRTGHVFWKYLLCYK